MARADGGADMLDAAVTVDAGLEPGIDSGGVFSDAGPPAPMATGEGDVDDAFSGAVTDLVSCRDGMDNDDDDLSDCADPFCQRYVPSCCVGRASEQCCETSTLVDAPLGECPGDLAGCSSATALHFFGGANPDVRVESGETDPSVIITHEEADTGFVLGSALDARGGDITLSASIALPRSPGLVSALGIGFVPGQGEVDDLVRVAPSIGLLLSGNRDQVIVMVGGRPQSEHSLEGHTGYIDCRVTLRADGSATVSASTAEQQFVNEDLAVAGSSVVRAVFWGRGTNPGEETPGRAREIAVSQLNCDMPDALTRTPEAVVPDAAAPPETWSDRRIGTASALLSGETTRVAMEINGDIYLGTGQADSVAFEVADAAELSETDSPWGEDGVAHPALLRNADNAVELWFTAYSGGVTTIGSILERDGGFPSVDAAVRLSLDAVSAEDAPGLASVDRPAPFLVNGELMLLVHEVYSDGDEALGVWSPGVSPVRRGEVTRRNADDVFAFDRDELGGASVLFADGAYRAYFAGRRGLPWAIGVAVSDDGVTWYPEASPILTRTDSGADSLGVRGPSAVLTGKGLDLYYLSTDGMQSRIGLARSPYPQYIGPE